jgi:hypothetical protein
MRASLLLFTLFAALGCDAEMFHTTGCFDTETVLDQCPQASELEPEDLYLPYSCGGDLHIMSIDGEGEPTIIQTIITSPGCCYPVTVIDRDSVDDCDI